MRIMIHFNLPLINSHLILIAKNRRNLLQRQAPRVREEQEHYDAADSARDDENEIELPPDMQERGGRGLQPYDVHEGDHCDSQADALRAEVRGEQLGEVRELGAIEAEAVGDLEDEEHCYCCGKGSVVGGGHEVCYEGGFDDQSYHAAEDAGCHVFVAREEVHEAHGHDVYALREGEPGCGEEELFYGREAEAFVEGLTVV